MHSTETKIYTTILIAAGVLAIILVYFVVNIIRQQRKNLIFQKEKIQAEITTLENERRRIASDLHDDLGPLLSAVKLQINSVEVPDGEDRELIERSGMYIDNILSRIREISNNLMPQVLSRKGLVIALQEFIDNLTLGHPFDIVFNSAGDISLKGDREIHLYRIILEVIHNALKHSNASKLEVMIRNENDYLRVDIADNGSGFEYYAINKTGSGLGLKNIASRVEMLKGNLYVDTQPGEGTKYRIEIPL
ncbi:MAG TPA: sensor histidine kinase [Chitinophagaceae bacterium]|jgi:signal transduction histidine kinase